MNHPEPEIPVAVLSLDKEVFFGNESYNGTLTTSALQAKYFWVSYPFL